MNFQTILMPKEILEMFVTKKLVPWNHSYLKECFKKGRLVDFNSGQKMALRALFIVICSSKMLLAYSAIFCSLLKGTDLEPILIY